nr:hypothetical protein [Tanacetum cinerariifolium]
MLFSFGVDAAEDFKEYTLTDYYCWSRYALSFNANCKPIRVNPWSIKRSIWQSLRVIEGVVQPLAPTTIEQRSARKNELKARGTLLMALPDTHQLKFNIHKDAKTLMEAIEKWFGGNKETKKVQKTLLKQQYENFNGLSFESLFLRSLPTDGELIPSFWRNKTDLEDQSLDDQFNSLKIYEAEVKSSSSASTSTQNIAFVSSQHTDSTNDSVSDVGSVSAASAKVHVFAHPNVDTLSDAVIYSFFATQSNSLQLDNDDLKQIDADDLEEIYLIWQMAMLTMRAKRFLQRIGRNLGANGTTSIGFDMSKVECYNCHRRGYFARECRSPKDTKRNVPVETQMRNVPVETSTSNALVSQCDGVGSYDWSFQAEEEPTNYALMAFTFSSSSSSDNENLSHLLASQTNDKTGLGYDNQVFNGFVFDCDEMFSSESDVSMPASPVYDRYKSGEGYHDVPPPYTGTFMPSKPDLVFHDAPTVTETVHTTFNVELSLTNPDKDLSHSYRPSAPVIKDWVSDLEDESEAQPTQNASSFVQPPKHVKTSRPSVKPVEYPILADNLRKDSPKSRGHSDSRNKKACFFWNHAQMGNHQHYASTTHPNPQRHVVPTAVLTRPRPANNVITKSHSPPRRTINLRSSPTHSNFHHKVTTVKTDQDKGFIDSGCSRHMTGNMSYLFDFEAINRGYLAFGGNPKSGKITGKGKIRTGKLDFDDVYFVKELKFNLFSVLQMCYKKNSVLFKDIGCIVLSFDFKLLDENHVLLRVSRENNMYNVDLNNIVLSGDWTCLFAKATLDEYNIWHRRLGHINFKTVSKLVKGNLVRGLPSKVFKNNHTCVACKKGKQHRASCKTKPVSFISQPLQRFSWVFFLATKDETSPILKTFITGIENQLSLKVKIIISDNGMKFKNQDLNQVFRMKGIKREFSVARTPQQNGITKRKNRTIIEATRTMLADSLLPILFWAEAVNTACYVQNRVLVTKPHNKTPYELLLGRIPSIGFMRPFGCLVTILNTLDPLGKFDGNADDGFLVGYSISSKAFRVFNSRTRIVQETLHINFLENKPNAARSGPTWLFDIDTLTKSMNYQPVTAGNQPYPSADPQNTDDDTTFEVKKPEFEVEKLEFDVHVSPSSSAKTKKHDNKPNKEAKGKSHVEFSTGFRNLCEEFEDFSNDSTNEVNVSSTPVPFVGEISIHNTNTFSVAGPSNTVVRPTLRKSSYVDPSQYPGDLNTPALEDITYSDDEEDVGAEADFTNLETTINVGPILTTRVHKDHPMTQIIGDLSSAIQTRSMTKMVKDQGGLTQINNEDFHTCMLACFLSQKEPKRVHQALKDPSWIEAMQEKLLQFKMQKVWVLVDLPNGHTQEEGIDYEKVFAPIARIEAIRFKDLDYPDKVYKVVKALYGLHQAPRAWYETLANYLSENGFQRERINQTLFIKKQKGDILLVQVYGLQVKQKPDGIFISQDKYVAKILRMFGLTYGKSASTPIDTEKPLLKDPDGEDVDVHTYRSMIGSLMYLTSSRPDIMFATVVATLSTEAEYVATASCCAQVPWIQN